MELVVLQSTSTVFLYLALFFSSSVLFFVLFSAPEGYILFFDMSNGSSLFTVSDDVVHLRADAQVAQVSMLRLTKTLALQTHMLRPKPPTTYYIVREKQ